MKVESLWGYIKKIYCIDTEDGQQNFERVDGGEEKKPKGE